MNGVEMIVWHVVFVVMALVFASMLFMMGRSLWKYEKHQPPPDRNDQLRPGTHAGA